MNTLLHTLQSSMHICCLLVATAAVSAPLRAEEDGAPYSGPYYDFDLDKVIDGPKPLDLEQHRVRFVQDDETLEGDAGEQPEALPPARPSAPTPSRQPSPLADTQFPSSRDTYPFARPTDQLAGLFDRSPGRLVAAPDMFGDSNHVIQGLAFSGADDIAFGIPIAAGAGRFKIADNNRALPTDRVYFMYHHLHNGVIVSRFPGPPPTPPAVVDSMNLDIFTVGIEKTFICKCWSVEVRMPLADEISTASSPPGGAPDFTLEGGHIGNLAVSLKHLLYRDPATAVAAGLAVTAPLGSDARGSLPALGISYAIHNDAFHVSPYLGFLATPTERFFFHGFAQVDFATNGNRIDVVDTMTGMSDHGHLNEQTLLYLDLSAGYWWHRDRCARITGVASVIEFHYTTSIQDADTFAAFAPVGLPRFGAPPDHLSVANLTLGLHTEFANTSALRFGLAFPLSEHPNRNFDAELQLQLNRRF